jgi:hypothetical protein
MVLVGRAVSKGIVGERLKQKPVSRKTSTGARQYREVRELLIQNRNGEISTFFSCAKGMSEGGCKEGEA